MRFPQSVSHSKVLLEGQIQTALCHVGDNGQILHSVGTSSKEVDNSYCQGEETAENDHETCG